MKEITIKIKSDDFRAIYKMLNFFKLELGPSVEISSVEFAEPAKPGDKGKGIKQKVKTFSLEGANKKERSAKVEDLMKNLSTNIKH